VIIGSLPLNATYAVHRAMYATGRQPMRISFSSILR